MAGRPAAPMFIVPPHLLRNPLLLVELDATMRDIVTLTATPRLAMEWCATYHLLANECTCGCEAASPMRLQQRAGDRYIDGFAWSCRDCHGQVSVHKGSFFELSRLTLQQLIDLIYLWSMDMRQSEAERQCRVSHPTMVDWQNFVREICCQYMLDHPMELGRPGKIVEIDESYFMHRKYHQGAHRDGQWVLGMMERDSQKCVLIEVPNRTAQTLLPLIQQHVLPGTRIITDGWQGYNQLQQHDVVNHHLAFVDPHDPTIHTNGVEGLWGNCKAKFRAMHGTRPTLFPSYLAEFMWRRMHPTNAFGNILYWVAHYYPL